MGGVASIVVAHWTLAGIIALLPAPMPNDDPSSSSCARPSCCSQQCSRSAPASSSACSRRCTARARISSRRSCARHGPAVGCARGRTRFPHVARDRADRALDGAPHLRRSVHQEPAQRQPRRSRAEDRQRHHVRHLAGAERLQARTLGRAVHARRRSDRRTAGRDRRDRVARAAAGRQQLGQASVRRGLQEGPRHGHRSALQ